MAKNFIQEGERIVYTNSTGSAIASGDVVPIGKVLGIALVNIADTKIGAVALEGVWEVPKTTGIAITQGDELFWNTGTGKVTKTATDRPMGLAFKSELSAATTVQVKLYESGNNVPQAATVAALVDNTGGVANGTLAIIPVGTPASLAAQGTINATIADNLADLAASNNAILTALKAASLMA